MFDAADNWMENISRDPTFGILSNMLVCSCRHDNASTNSDAVRERSLRFEQLSNPHVVSLHEVTVRIRGPDACAIYFM